MLIRIGNKKGISRYEAARGTIELYKMGQYSYNRTVAMLQKIYGDYRKNSIIHKSLQQLHRGTINVDMCANLIDQKIYE